MMFLLTKDWAVGSAGGTRLDLTVPAGTHIDGNNAQWRGTPLPAVMPIDAMAMDEEAALILLKWCDEGLWHRLSFGPGIDLDAILTKARQRARGPRTSRGLVR